MELKQHYDSLYENAVQQIRSDSYNPDPMIDASKEEDRRLGISLLLRPSEIVQKSIQELLEELREVEPDQYFYPSSDLHVTVLSIVSCYDGFQLEQIESDLNQYVETIQKSLAGDGAASPVVPFHIKFEGVTASHNCVLVKGYPELDTAGFSTLDRLRDNLRTNFGKATHLEQSLDKRYTLQTAHSTVFRLRTKLQDKERYLAFLEGNQERAFGSFQVQSLELVLNDWYQRKARVKALHRFDLVSEDQGLHSSCSSSPRGAFIASTNQGGATK